MKDYKRILQGVVNIINITKKSNIGFANICAYIGENCPELKESEDERIRKKILTALSCGHDNSDIYGHGITYGQVRAWLEKQGEKELDPRYIILDKLIEADDIYQMSVNDAMVEEAKNKAIEALSKLEISKLLGLEKQGEQDMIRLDKAIKFLDEQLVNDKDEVTGEPFINFQNYGTFKETFISFFKRKMLEKQSEKPQGKLALEATKEEKVDNQNCVKPVDEVEPKFKVGNWYQCTKDFFGKGVTFDKNTAYYCAKEGCLQNEYGCHIAIVKDLYDNFKLWTIQDAKDGDVLEFGDHGRLVVGIVSYVNKTTGKVDVNCLLENNNFKVGNYYNLDTIKPHPATKEQRDLLFRKMSDASYAFDLDNKEMIKIEDGLITGIEIPFGAKDSELEEVFYSIPNGFHAEIEDDKVVIKKGEQKSWSEEDKRSIRDSIFYLKSAKKYFEKDDDILWDEKWFNLCIEFLEALYKRLQPQPQWKPSDEQMDALEHFVRSIGESGYASPHDNNTKLVYSLLNDLKKLKL